MRVFLLISLLIGTLVGFIPAATAKSSSPVVMVEVIEGDTAFMLNTKAQKAWWVVGECRRPIPIEKTSENLSGKTRKTSGNSMMSEKIVKNVRLGSRQIRLQQQFRFDLASDSTSVTVFNSVRGGWSPVDVKRNDACLLDATCRSRMELPEC
ncbi:MAG: hypothetical protein ABJG88_06805 [Litorimonas sp.]